LRTNSAYADGQIARPSLRTPEALMFSKLLSVRPLAVLLAALLLVVGVQFSASAATARAISIAASPAASSVGSAVTFSGKITKSPRGTIVLIQRKSGKKWVKAGSTRTVNAVGSYAVRLTRPKVIANYAFRAYVAKKGKLKAATSRAVTVAALKRTFASLSATPASLTAGSPTTLAGTVFPFVKGTVITVQKKVGSTWTSVGTTTVTANGTFAKAIVPSTSTKFRASVPRAGINAPVLSNERDVVAKPLITTTALTLGTRLGAYSVTLATYGAQAGTWTASPLPAGLTLNAAKGTISGTPTTIGDTNVVIGFTQIGTGLSAATKTLTLRINQAVAPTISTTSLPAGTVDAGYDATLVATGNPVGTWTASPLPAGLVLNAGTGAITGTPTQAGVGDTQVVVGFTQTNTGLSATPRTITLHVNNGAAPVITTTSLPAGSLNVAYTAQLAVAGNPAGTWSATGLPAWAHLDTATGAITGTPQAGDAGDSQVTVSFVQTSNGLAAAPKVLLLQVDPGSNPVITTTSLPTGTRLTPYSTTLTAAGSPVGTWTASPLPAGLTLNQSTGVISGTPTDPAPSDTAVVIGFTETGTGLAATPKTLNLHVNEAAAPTISTVSLSNADRFTPYSAQLSATGNPVGTWTATGLPPGLDISAGGLISGVPTTAGDYDVTVTFTQTDTGLSATKLLVLHVNEAAAPVISTANLPEGNRLAFYTTQLVAAGSPAGTWGATNLPAGLGIDPSTGVISGTPTAVETKDVVITFTQTSTGLSAAPKTLSLKINEAVAPVISTPTALPNALRYHAYSTQLAVAGDPPGTWTVTGLPSGLSGSSSGLISGTPPNAGDFNVTVKFTQTNTGLSSTKVLTLHVDQSAPIITTTTVSNTSPLLSYSFQLQVAPAPVGKWSMVSGSLPVGISLHDNGVISGSAVLPGNFTFTVKFTETSTSLSSTRQFTMKVS
jgi:hypothetical protein